MAGEESERNRLARDLHDGPGGILTSIPIGLSNLVEAPTGRMTEDVYSRMSRLDIAVNELQLITYNLMPVSYFGLVWNPISVPVCSNPHFCSTRCGP